jgi:hypothetical protein
MKILISTMLSLALLAAASFKAEAGQGSLTATNNTILTATTNLLAGGSGSLFAGNASEITFQPMCTLTNASTNTFVWDGSVDNANWVLRVMTMTASKTTTGTNTVQAGITNMPAGFRYPYYRVSIENPSVYATSTPKVLTYIH